MTEAPGFISLDQKRHVSRRAMLIGGLAAATYLALGIFVRLNADVTWPAVPVFSSVHAFAMALVGGLTGLILMTYAVSTRERGYLVLGGTYLIVGGWLLVFPLFYPGGVITGPPPTILLGNAQSAPWLYMSWHLLFVIGVGAASLTLMYDTRPSARLSGPTPFHPIVAIGVVLAAVIGFPLTLTRFSDSLPPLIAGNTVTPLTTNIALLIPTVTVIVLCLVLVWVVRRQTSISLWLLLVMVVTLGENVVVFGANRYTALWYYGRFAGFVAALVLLVMLIAEIGRMGRAAERIAANDPLTGVMSRASFLRLLNTRLDQGERCRMLLIDLDDFKAVNDQYGHLVGDVVLARQCERMGDLLAPGAVVGRIGGDEFAMLLEPEVGDEPPRDLLRAILASLRAPIVWDSGTITTTASIGMAIAPSVGARSADLLANVDLALYEAKRAGGNRWVRYDPEMSQRAGARTLMRQQLHEAIEERAFALDYQPIVDVVGGQIVGAEALARWLRGDQRISAGRFIQVAEESGQIVSLGQIVLDLLEQDLPAILAADQTIRIHFNVSVRELGDVGVVGRLLGGRLMEFADHLTIEVTESMVLRPGEDAFTALESLRAAGYQLAVDDFGMGYSNLTLLEELRPDVVKADRSLVVRAGKQFPGASSFLASALSVADSLQATLIAEGVESQAEAEAVRQVGVRHVQGFRYGRPMPAASFVERISDWGGGPTLPAPRTELDVRQGSEG